MLDNAPERGLLDSPFLLSHADGGLGLHKAFSVSPLHLAAHPGGNLRFKAALIFLSNP